jgi:cystathionine beta-lyase/cystathionine gamma-synthase
LRKQAGLSSSSLKNKSDAKNSEKEEKDEKKEERETSLKRKASSESQLSPPPTPETRRIENKRSRISETDDEEEDNDDDEDDDSSDDDDDNEEDDDDEEEEEETENYRSAPQQKRTLQEHKSPKLEPVPEPTLSTVSTVSSITAPVTATTQQSEHIVASAPTHIVDSQQWTTFDPSLCQSIDDLIPLTNDVYTDAYASSNNDLLFMPPNCGTTTDVYDNCDPLAMQTPVPDSYNNMVDPTLFNPYYFQQEPNACKF